MKRATSKVGIGGDDRADAGSGALLVNQPARLGRIGGQIGDRGHGLGFGLRFRADHRLLLVAGPLAEHGIEPQPDEEGDHGQEDDLDGQPNSPGSCSLHRRDAAALSNKH